MLHGALLKWCFEHLDGNWSQTGYIPKARSLSMPIRNYGFQMIFNTVNREEREREREREREGREEVESEQERS